MYLVITRNGEFTPAELSSNQCGSEETTLFSYEIKCLFKVPNDFSSVVDENKFVIEHKKIDDFIHSLYLKGSCEEIHQKIGSNLHFYLETKSNAYVGFKLSIKPIAEGRRPFHAKAFMTSFWIPEDKIIYLT